LSDKPDYKPKVIHINQIQDRNQYAFEKLEKAINEAYKNGVPHSLVVYMLHMYLQIETNRIFDDEE
jgi:hypothetical protein